VKLPKFQSVKETSLEDQHYKPIKSYNISPMAMMPTFYFTCMCLNTFSAHHFFANVRCGPKVRKLYPFLGADNKLERVMILPWNFQYLFIKSCKMILMKTIVFVQSKLEKFS
jgi:hypothetical protein